jgi:[glutamine synthetase] adenylyltransferase / [glutamine synthetase]-adenylyl-L-tyrosine phosphorylase
MTSAAWSKAIQGSADPKRARRCLDLLVAEGRKDLEKASPEYARVIGALLGGSEALGNLLVSHPEWLELISPELVEFPRRKQGVRAEVNAALEPRIASGETAAALAWLRQYKQREMLRIAARDLARLSTAPQTTLEISDLADVCLGAVWRVCQAQLVERYGRAYHQEPSGRWLPTEACVLGLGKLGGQELNYSSDVDVVFVYSQEGSVFKTPGGKPPVAKGRQSALRSAMTSHAFFNRLAEAFIAEVARMAPEGFLYRIDLRLRPEGDSGPLTRSLESYENYYAQWGQTWERMMLIKARPVAGNEAIGAEFLEMVHPFRYPRSVNDSVLREIALMKGRIENEVVKAGELERNVKLGRGGIREIEFTVQSLQLLHAGRQPFLQGAQTLPCLAKLAQYELLPKEDARGLEEAYCFLRDVEHRLQMEGNLQTHTIPVERPAIERLARSMGFDTPEEFEKARQGHSGLVRRTFERVLRSDVAETKQTSEFPGQFQGAEQAWKEILAQRGFREPDKAFRVLREFVEGPGYIHVSQRTTGLAHGLLPRLFGVCPRPGAKPAAGRAANVPDESEAERPVVLSDPDRVVTRLDSFISAYGARSTLFELWNSNPGIFDLLVLLFDRSEFLAELAIQTPDLVDDLVIGERLRQRKTAEETLTDLRHGLADADQHLWMRRYYQAEMMRIGLRDILGLADFEQYLSELSALANACVRYALEVVMRKHRLARPPFAVIGLGKLGGAEIDYGSDLDIVFVADAKPAQLSSLGRMAIELMDLLSTRTEQGLVFRMDARLRPDGEKGLLVNTLKEYENYYRRRAQLWEIQALTRARFCAGAAGVGEGFEKLAGLLTDFRQPSLPQSAFTPDWKGAIHRMRLRIQKERTPAGKDALAIKTGIGGLMDVEFVAQALCLEQGWREPNTLRALEQGRQVGALADADKLITNYRRLRRVEGILRRWSYEGESVLPDTPAPYHRVAVRCGFDSSDEFSQALAKWRGLVREVYTKVLGVGESAKAAPGKR